MIESETPDEHPADLAEPYAAVSRSDATGWVAWALLGGFLLVLVGAVHLAAGLIALFRPQVLAAGRAGMLLPVGLTTLAWIQLLLGVLAVVTGVGLIRGRDWARLLTILLGSAATLVNFAFVGVHPVWSITVIVLIAVVIYAVAVHGGEVAGAYPDPEPGGVGER
jgi:hypothetical protein